MLVADFGPIVCSSESFVKKIRQLDIAFPNQYMWAQALDKIQDAQGQRRRPGSKRPGLRKDPDWTANDLDSAAQKLGIEKIDTISLKRTPCIPGSVEVETEQSSTWARHTEAQGSMNAGLSRTPIGRSGVTNCAHSTLTPTQGTIPDHETRQEVESKVKAPRAVETARFHQKRRNREITGASPSTKVRRLDSDSDAEVPSPEQMRHQETPLPDHPTTPVQYQLMRANHAIAFESCHAPSSPSLPEFFLAARSPLFQLAEPNILLEVESTEQTPARSGQHFLSSIDETLQQLQPSKMIGDTTFEVILGYLMPSCISHIQPQIFEDGTVVINDKQKRNSVSRPRIIVPLHRPRRVHWVLGVEQGRYFCGRVRLIRER